MSYTIWCFLPGCRSAFPVDIEETRTVAHLKDAIKAKLTNTLATVDSHALSLYHINVEESDDDERVAIEEVNRLAQDLSSLKRLHSVDSLEDVFESSAPPPETINILVLAPGGEPIGPRMWRRYRDHAGSHTNDPSTTRVVNTCAVLRLLPPIAFKRKDRTEPTVVSELYDSILTFETNQVGDFDDTVPFLNSMYHTTNFPAFIAGIKEQLKAKRFISDAQRDILDRIKINVNAYFEVDKRNDNCEDAEIAFYVLFSVPDSAKSDIMTRRVSKGETHLLFRYISTYLCEKYSGGTFEAEAIWPLHLVARVEGTPTSYHPRSDFMFLLDGYPFVLIEACSEPEQRDHYRMLVQAGVLVRVMNSIKPKNKDSFVAVAVYITKSYIAKRFLVYQPDRDSQAVEYVQDNFCLKTPRQAFMFFFELHNLLSALPPDVELSKAASRLASLSKTVKDARIPPYSRAVKEAQDLDDAPSGGRESRPFDDSSTVRKLSDAGYRVLRLPPGFSPLYPLPPNLSRARRLTGENVVLKLVKSHEFAIHSFLSSIKSECNHTIHILDQIALGIEKVIVMPAEVALPNVYDAVFKTGGNRLAYQFLEGVRFMHQQRVAHLDLKADNIVVTRRGLRLVIIDFNLSVQVLQQESWIKGYRGTEEWVAPEIEEPDPVYRPIRADLWSAGRVLQYFANRQHSDTESPFKSLMNALLGHDPAHRPLLSETRLHYADDQAWKF